MNNIFLMGNACCNRNINEDEFSKINNIDAYLIYLLKNLNEVERIVSEYSRLENEKEKSISFDQFQYYIKLNNVLIKLKINLEKYKYVKKNQEDIPGKDPIDYKTKSFNLSEAKYYLFNVLNTQESNDINKLQELDEEMINAVFDDKSPEEIQLQEKKEKEEEEEEEEIELENNE